MNTQKIIIISLLSGIFVACFSFAIYMTRLTYLRSQQEKYNNKVRFCIETATKSAIRVSGDELVRDWEIFDREYEFCMKSLLFKEEKTI